MSGCNQLESKDRYVNKEHGISFKVPEGWSRDAPGKGHTWLAAYIKNRSGIGVQFVEVSGKINLPKFGQLQAAKLEASGFQIVSPPTEMEINGRKAIQIAVTAITSTSGNGEALFGKKLDVPNDVPFVFLSYYIDDTSRNKLFVLSLAVPQAEYAVTAKEFMVTVDSFQIR